MFLRISAPYDQSAARAPRAHCAASRSPRPKPPRIGWLHAVLVLVLATASAARVLAPGGFGIGVTSMSEMLLALAIAALVLAAGLAVVALRTVINPGRRTVDTHPPTAQIELRASSALSRY